jgi:Zn-dependent protease with chaperone function
MVATDLFLREQTLRVPGERRALWTCVLAAPLVIAVASLVFPAVSLSEFILLIAAGLVFVSIGRGRLLGSSIRIEGRQFPEIAELTTALAAQLGMPAPQVFVRDDPFVPITTVGIGEPYSLIISSQYYEHLRRGELRFLIARELGHIAAGHTRLTSLLSVSGRENPVVALVFGAWLRKTEFTADRVGFLCCDGLDHALGAIAITTFHAIGRRVDLDVLAEQRAELDSEPALRLGEWIAGAPYATNRLDALRKFATEPAALAWREKLVASDHNPLALIDDPSHRVERAECASVVRRLCAMLIDLAVIAAVLQIPIVANVSHDVGASKGDDAFATTILHYLPVIKIGAKGVFVFMAFFIYSGLLVALGGQTLGMTVMDVRVVRTTDFGRPGIFQSLWRYFVAFCSAMSSIALVGFFMRIHPHDRLSGTRLVGGRKAG